MKYTDPDGRASLSSMIMNICSFMLSSEALGGSSTGLSLYQQQYKNSVDEAKYDSIALTVMSVIPGEIGLAASFANLALSFMDSDDAEVCSSERLQFINGAKSEINKIDELLSGLKNEDHFSEFLMDEKSKLINEIQINTTLEENTVFSDINGNIVSDPRETLPNKPSIDYQKEFSLMKGNKFDE